MNYELDKILKAIKKIAMSFKIIIASGVVAFFGVAVLTYGATRNTYSASVNIYSVGEYQEAQLNISALYEYDYLLSSNRVLNNVSEIFGNSVSLQTLRSIIFLNAEDTMLTLTVQSDDPDLCIKLVNVVAEEYISEFLNITGVESIQILDQATTADMVVNGTVERLKTRLFISIAVAMAVAGAIGIRDLVSNKINAVWMATAGEDLTLLGVIPETDI